MKVIEMVLVFLLVLSFCQGQAAQKNEELKALEIGDTIPDLVFHQMIGYKDSAARLSDFHGKAVILDFWATWCVPCIASFPKLEHLQNEFSKDIQIILASNDAYSRLTHFYAQNRQFGLPTAYYPARQQLDILFPHREVPHYVWISKDRVLYAITDASQVSETSVKSFIRQTPQHLVTKNDSLSLKNLSGIVVDSIQVIGGSVNTISLAPNRIYESSISKFDQRLTSYMSLGRGAAFKYRFLEMQNVSPVHMMTVALGFTSSKDSWRFFLDLKDSTLTYPERDYKTWLPEHSYSYRLILNKPDSARRFELFRRDLELVFGLTSYPKKIRVPTLVLRRLGWSRISLTPDTDSSYIDNSIYRICIVNKPVGSLLKVLEYYNTGRAFKRKEQLELPITDLTGIKGNVTIQIENVNVRDLAALNEKLSAYGLAVSIENIEQELIVITDKKNTPTDQPSVGVPGIKF